jgi:hypothetical protein
MKLVILLGASLLVSAGCNTGTAPRNGGALRVLLTDAPFPYDQVSRVDLYLVRIQASGMRDTGTSAGTGLQTIVEPHRSFNLLELAGGAAADLGKGVVVSGRYDQFRLTIAADSSSITLKNGTVLRQNSGIDWLIGGLTQFSLNIFTDPPVPTSDSGAVVVIDFNVGQSFRPVNPANAAAGFTFIGYVSAINSARSGSVSGTVVGAGPVPVANASVTLWVPNPVYPTDTAAWGVFGAAMTNTQGEFRMPYAQPGTYVLGVDPPAGSAYRAAWVSGVNVTIGQMTAVGTVTVSAAP